MTERVAFYHCEICGNLVGLINDGGGELVCCGQPMTKLEANTVDAAHEKHVPVVTKKDGQIIVEVGEVAHPMTDAHYIQWIALVNDTTTMRVSLNPGDEPKAVFCYDGNGEAYAYCNLHGLWKTEF